MAGRRRKSSITGWSGEGAGGEGIDLLAGGYIRSVELLREQVPSFDRYPFSIPSIRELSEIDLHPYVTFLVGENGVGKSTLIEGIAVAAGFNAEGGSKNFEFSTHGNTSELYEVLRLVRGMRRERDGFFLRAESLYNVASEIERLSGAADNHPARLPGRFMQEYGGRSLHAQSHGESFMALVLNRFRGQGLYILDE